MEKVFRLRMCMRLTVIHVDTSPENVDSVKEVVPQGVG